MPSPLTGSAVVASTLTGNAPIDSLLDGYHWASSVISYSFIDSSISSVSAANYGDPSFWYSTKAFNTVQQASTLEALNAWANVANISWTYSNDNALYAGTVRIGFSSSFSWGGYVGETYLPSASPSGGDIWLNPLASDSLNALITGTFQASSFQKGDYAFYTLLHELGHALGLKHPFEDSTNGGGASIAGTSNFAWDSQVFTLMSYTVDQNHPDAIGFSFNPTTPMLLDIAALQAVYGANVNFNAGDTTYAFTDAGSQRYFQTIWDGGGTNTISYEGTHAAAIDLRAGYGSTIGNPVYEYTQSKLNAYQVKNIWIAQGAKIDVLDLSNCNASYSVTANDDGDVIYAGVGAGTITGGNGGDAIHTNTGNEAVACGAGIDHLYFSGKKSSYSVTYQAGTFTVSSAQGTDSISGAEYFHFSDGVLASSATLTNTTNTISLGATNPSIHTTNANDFITGLSAVDSVAYSGSYANYSMFVSTTNNAVVQDKTTNRDGTDALVNIERLSFSDTNVALDSGRGQNAGEAYRLYKAAFNRTPDTEGLGFWIYSLDTGHSLNNASQGFIGSPEFQALYGANSSDATFLTKLYTNVLGRNYDQSGYDFWLNGLKNGLQRDSLLSQFSESVENCANVAPLIGQGITYKEYVG